MRKVFLHVFVGLSFCAQAQYEPENYMSNTWAMEDMSNPYGAPSFGQDKKGVYFWRPKDEWYFKTTMSRVADADATNGNGYVSFISTHTSGSYHPVGVGFGTSTSGAQYSIDMSGVNGDTVYIEVENMSDQDLNIRVGLKDESNNLIDTKSGTPLTNIPSGIIDMDLPRKSVRSKKFVYHGGYYAEWGDKNKCTDWANPNNKTTPCAIKKFDFTKVVGANITINSNNPQNVGVENAEVRIHKMQFGLPPVITSINEEYVQPSGIFTLSPNPVSSGWVRFNQKVESCTVYDSKGILVEKLANVQVLDVSSYKQGIYVVQTNKGSQRLLKN